MSKEKLPTKDTKGKKPLIYGEPHKSIPHKDEYVPSDEVVSYFNNKYANKSTIDNASKLMDSIAKKMNTFDSINTGGIIPKTNDTTTNTTNPQFTSLEPKIVNSKSGVVTLSNLNTNPQKKQNNNSFESHDPMYLIGQKFIDEFGTEQKIINRSPSGDFVILSDGKNESKKTAENLSKLIANGSFKKNEEKNPINTFANPEGTEKKLNSLGWKTDFVNKYLDKLDIKQIIATKRMFNEADRDYFESKANNPDVTLNVETVELEKEIAQLQQELQEVDKQEQHDMVKLEKEIAKQKQLISELEREVEKEKIGGTQLADVESVVEHIPEPVEKKNNRAEIEELRLQLEKELPDHQANTRTEATKKLIAFAEKIYGKNFKGDFEKGEYVSWLQSLGAKAYEATWHLNDPKIALEKLTQSEYYKHQTK